MARRGQAPPCEVGAYFARTFVTPTPQEATRTPIELFLSGIATWDGDSESEFSGVNRDSGRTLLRRVGPTEIAQKPHVASEDETDAPCARAIAASNDVTEALPNRHWHTISTTATQPSRVPTLRMRRTKFGQLR
jgi:hypothetical protein